MHRARNRSRAISGSAVTSCPRRVIRPLSMVVSPATQLSSVLLPQPLRPRRTTCSPGADLEPLDVEDRQRGAVGQSVRLLDVFQQQHRSGLSVRGAGRGEWGRAHDSASLRAATAGVAGTPTDPLRSRCRKSSLVSGRSYTPRGEDLTSAGRGEAGVNRRDRGESLVFQRFRLSAGMGRGFASALLSSEAIEQAAPGRVVQRGRWPRLLGGCSGPFKVRGSLPPEGRRGLPRLAGPFSLREPPGFPPCR